MYARHHDCRLFPALVSLFYFGFSSGYVLISKVNNFATAYGFHLDGSELFHKSDELSFKVAKLIKSIKFTSRTRICRENSIGMKHVIYISKLLVWTFHSIQLSVSTSKATLVYCPTQHNIQGFPRLLYRIVYGRIRVNGRMELRSIITNYSPTWRGKYPPLFTGTEVNNCFGT